MQPEQPREALRYAGFWSRVGATLIDGIIMAVGIIFLFIAAFGVESLRSPELLPGKVNFLINWVLPAIYTFGFWTWRLATPGKMLISAEIRDTDTGGPPSLPQWILRYLGYFLSAVPLGLGILWVAFDPRKQGWHDKLADTVVVFKPDEESAPAVSDSPNEACRS